jgi:hypothetical protein
MLDCIESKKNCRIAFPKWFLCYELGCVKIYIPTSSFILGIVSCFYYSLSWFTLGINMTGLSDNQTADKAIFLIVSVQLFLEEIGIWIHGFSKEDLPHQCVWASSSPLRAHSKNADGQILCLLDLWHPSPPALDIRTPGPSDSKNSHNQFPWFSKFQIQTGNYTIPLSWFFILQTVYHGTF